MEKPKVMDQYIRQMEFQRLVDAATRELLPLYNQLEEKFGRDVMYKAISYCYGNVALMIKAAEDFNGLRTPNIPEA